MMDVSIDLAKIVKVSEARISKRYNRKREADLWGTRCNQIVSNKTDIYRDVVLTDLYIRQFLKFV